MDLPEVKLFGDRKQTAIILAAAGVVLLGAGVFMALWKGDTGEVEVVKKAAEVEMETIKVDVGGAVVKTGVYELKNEARVADAVAAAGGLTAEADIEWVEKYLNLAAKVADGEKVYIPRKNEAETGLTDKGGQTGTININTASQKELESLPGVGEVTAGKIIAGRPYGKVEELLEKKIVGQKVFSDVKDLVSVW